LSAFADASNPGAEELKVPLRKAVVQAPMKYCVQLWPPRYQQGNRLHRVIKAATKMGSGD